jgi:hypothetical protein
MLGQVVRQREVLAERCEVTVIGVTGHRFLNRAETIAAGIDEALGRIKEAFPGEPMTVVSPLAEGADQLLVQRVLVHSEVRLMVPLPLSPAEYLMGFSTCEARDTFHRLLAKADEVIQLPRMPQRDEAYAAVGHYVLDRCQVLIAVWDGQPAQGRGGTAEIVALARQRGLPLAWIYATNCKPDTPQPPDCDREQGAVVFERFPVS